VVSGLKVDIQGGYLVIVIESSEDLKKILEASNPGTNIDVQLIGMIILKVPIPAEIRAQSTASIEELVKKQLAGL